MRLPWSLSSCRLLRQCAEYQIRCQDLANGDEASADEFVRILLELGLAQGAAQQVLLAFVIEHDVRLVAIDAFAADRIACWAL